MTTKAKIRDLVDDVGADFSRCWQILCRLKSAVGAPGLADQILAFQPMLAGAISRLGEMRREIRQREKATVANKQRAYR